MDKIFGLKFNGPIIKIEEVDNDFDLSDYNYVCNVVQSVGSNLKKIIIAENEDSSSSPLKKWKITDAVYGYTQCLHGSYQRTISFTMVDEDGNEAYNIWLGHNDDTEPSAIVKAMFIKAQKIVEDYPSALIYKYFQELEDIKLSMVIRHHFERLFIHSYEPDLYSLIDNLKKASELLKKWYDTYKKAKELLSECNDSKSKKLLNELEDKFNDIISRLPQN